MNKKALTEMDIRSKFIMPAVVGANGDKWNLHTQIREEVYFTRGRVIVRGKTVKRGEARKADYILSYKPNLPLAVIEAKDNTHAVGAGMQQALEYAEILDVPFAYSSNGDAFLEHDRTVTSGIVTREIPLDQFPSPAELWSRYRAAPGSCGSRLVWTLSPTDGTRRTPRYYQQIAINRTVDAIARGEDRILRASCRTSSARCVVRPGGWMQGAARSQWHFHWQASQRSRRRPGAQPEGPNGLLALTNIKTRATPCKSSPKLDQRLPPKGRSAHSRGKFDRLLTMATGTGKTYTPFQIIWRLWKSGARKRILFLVDRNILADQTKTKQ
jgi:type I site-specific restriction endonuclease